VNNLEDILADSHIDGLARRKLEVWNLGWYSSSTRIESKTHEEILASTINQTSRKVSHEWFPRPELALTCTQSLDTGN